MIDPGLWGSTPFGNTTAREDYFGMESNWHQVLSDRISRLNGATYRRSPLGDGGGSPWLFAHQQELVAAARAVGIAAPPDLSSFNLSNPDEWASFHFLNANYHRLLGRASGL